MLRYQNPFVNTLSHATIPFALLADVDDHARCGDRYLSGSGRQLEHLVARQDIGIVAVGITVGGLENPLPQQIG